MVSVCACVSRRLYILCWSELSRRKLSPTLATPTTLVLTTLVAQCDLSRRKIGLLLEIVGRKFSHRPGNPATVGVVRWPTAGDTAGSSLRRLSSLQHRIYNLLARSWSLPAHRDPLCSYRVGGVDGSCAEHLTVESYTVIYAANSYTYCYLVFHRPLTLSFQA